jgi:hypothetical protein
MEIISRADAKARGLRRYYTGPCKRGHVAERHVSSRRCVVCGLAAVLAYSKTRKGQRTRKAYRQGENLARMNATPAARARRARYQQTPKGHEAQERYRRSVLGIEAQRRADQLYWLSDHGRALATERSRRYRASGKSAARKRERLLARYADPRSPDFDPVRAQNLIARRLKAGTL